jgi:hypothetical protein
MSKADHVDMLKRAIAANLEARMDHDRRQRRQRDRRAEPSRLEFINAADLARADADWLYLEEVIRDPVRKALRKQLRDLGQQLFDVLGTTAGMRDIACAIANLDRKHWHHRINILDKGWDGVGAGTCRWVA